MEETPWLWLEQVVKALPVNRSHKPLGEANKKAQFGKS
jgi:hypothetical protein